MNFKNFSGKIVLCVFEYQGDVILRFDDGQVLILDRRNDDHTGDEYHSVVEVDSLADDYKLAIGLLSYDEFTAICTAKAAEQAEATRQSLAQNRIRNTEAQVASGLEPGFMDLLDQAQRRL